MGPSIQYGLLIESRSLPAMPSNLAGELTFWREIMERDRCSPKRGTGPTFRQAASFHYEVVGDGGTKCRACEVLLTCSGLTTGTVHSRVCPASWCIYAALSGRYTLGVGHALGSSGSGGH